jgi:hypothetical protein
MDGTYFLADNVLQFSIKIEAILVSFKIITKILLFSENYFYSENCFNNLETSLAFTLKTSGIVSHL